MSTTTKNLNRLIQSLDEQMDGYIHRAANAERDVEILREELRDTRASLLAARTLQDRHENDLAWLRESNRNLEDKLHYAEMRLAPYTSEAIKEAEAWLRAQSMEDLTSLLEQENPAYAESGLELNPLKQKIPMIKLIRTRFSLVLKDSKDIIDRWYEEENA